MHRSKSIIFVPFVRDYARLRKSVEHISHPDVKLMVIDNSLQGIDFDAAGLDPSRVEDYRSDVPLSFCATQNLMMAMAKDAKIRHYFFAHSDIEITPDFFGKFVDHVDGLHESDPTWAIAFSHYDCMCAFRTVPALINGPWDVNLQQYASDNDWYNRMKALRGFTTVSRHTPELKHFPSTTINRSPLYHFVTDEINHSNQAGYYARKWGGSTGKEKWDGAHPWNDADIHRLVEWMRRQPVYEKLTRCIDTTEGNLLELSDMTVIVPQLRFHLAVLNWVAPRRVLETGTQKALYDYLLAVHLNDVRVTTCDVNPLSAAAVTYLQDAYPNIHIDFLHGNSMNMLDRVSEKFDLAYVDGGHDYEPCLSDLRNCARLGIDFIMVDDANIWMVQKAIDDVALEYGYSVMANPWPNDGRKLTLMYRF